MSETTTWPTITDEDWGTEWLLFDAPINLRLDTPYLNEGETMLRCDLPSNIVSTTTATTIIYYRRESSDRVNWGEWEAFGASNCMIDGSVDYETSDLFHTGLNVETNLTEARLRVTPPATLGNYYQYCARIQGPAPMYKPGTDSMTGIYDKSVSEWTLSENCLRYGHIEFGPYTDEPLVPGETFIKAVHMTELQERVATIYDHFAYGAFEYTPAIAGETSLGLWLMQVIELRTAIDAHFPLHEDWLPVTVNQPRADVMEQLRAVIAAL